MSEAISRRVDRWTRHALPWVTTLLLLLPGRMPIGIPGLQAVLPSLPLIAVFYWSLRRPDLFPAAAAFALGLIHDTFGAGPIGVSAVGYLLVHAIVTTQRRILTTTSFLVLWFAFAVLAALYFFVTWLLTCAVSASIIGGTSPVLQALTTIGFFPWLIWALVRSDMAVLKDG
jgi:rod shape-determining protein MreD